MESKQSDNQEIQVFQSRGNIQMYPNPKKIKLTDYYKEKVSWQALSCNNLGQPINIHKQSTVSSTLQISLQPLSESPRPFGILRYH